MRNYLRRTFGIDLRSLALFRICVGIILLIDICVCFSDLTVHYVDSGVLPRDVATKETLSIWVSSFHLITGSAIGQSILLIINMFLAFLFLIGYKTRIVTVLCWLFIVSLQARNVLILSGADDTLRLSLFFCMFLPLGARYSVDSMMNSGNYITNNRYFSMGTAAILIQISMIYIFSFILRDSPIWKEEYTALYYMFNIDFFSNDFGRLFLNYPPLLTALTFIFVWVELIGPIIVHIPWFYIPMRLLVIGIFFSMHIGIATTMGLGFFPFISMATWLLFLPSPVWDYITKKLQTLSRKEMIIYYDRGCDFCRKACAFLATFVLLPGSKIIPADADPKMLKILESKNSWIVIDNLQKKRFGFNALTYVMQKSPIFWFISYPMKLSFIANFGEKIYQYVAMNRPIFSKVLSPLRWNDFSFSFPRWQQIIVLVVILYVVFLNISSISGVREKFPKDLYGPSYMLGLYQTWNLFAPYPVLGDGWFVMPGKLVNGKEVDLWRNAEKVTWDKPDEVRHDFKNNRWVKYMVNLSLNRKWKGHLLYYGRYLCRQWNDKHIGDERLHTFSINYIMEKTLPDFKPPVPQKTNLWNHECFKLKK